jgi:ribosomal protein L7/L12
MSLEQISSDQLLLIIAGVTVVLAVLWYFARRGSRNSDIVGLGPTSPLDVDAEIRRLVAENKKIHAIKLYRDTHGGSLQEAKEYVESLESQSAPPPATRAVMEAEILALLRDGNKIEAIKRLREATGLGLKEAKDAIDTIEAANAGSPAGVYANVGRLLEEHPGTVKATVPAPAEVDTQIQSLLHDGKKIEAVKLYREVSGLGLKEAKDHVDAVERAMKL